LALKYLDRTDSLRLRRRPVYEAPETAIVRRELGPGQTFVDVGAHIGYYTVIASSLVGDAGTVFAMEPSPENFGVLVNNIRASGRSNVFAINKAASSKTGVTDLYLSPGNSGDNRLFPPGPPWQRVRVETVRLDDLFSAYAGRIDFIKCDTQGHELSVLRGAAETLGRFPSMKMLFEYWPFGIRQNGDSPSGLLEELAGLGFTVEWPGPSAVSRCTPENGKHCNLFLTRSR